MGDLETFFEELELDLEEQLERFQKEVAKMRIGEVNIESAKQIQVEAYGSKVPLYQVATLSAPNAMTLVVTPWDKNLLKNLADAINDYYGSDITPNIKDDAIYINFPPLTKERQQEYLKLIKKLAETYRQRLRDIRNEYKNKIESAKQEGNLTEDDYYKALEKLDTYTKKYVEQINSIYEHKKQELL